MLEDALPAGELSNPPADGDGTAGEIAPPIVRAPANENAPAPPAPDPHQGVCGLQVGGLDERGNTVKYIYACDRDYVVYYSRLEHSPKTPADPDEDFVSRRRRLKALRKGLRHHRYLPYESEGVQAQLSPDPAKRLALRRALLPLGTERAKLQALLSDWPRRQSYNSSIATALQLALDGDGNPEGAGIALQTLKDAKAAVLTEREIAGKSQYVRCALVLALFAVILLTVGQHNVFKGNSNFWVGAQAGVFGAVLSIAIGIRRRTVALNSGFAGNLSDSALRLVIGAVSGGTLVLLFATGLLPSLHTLQGEQDTIHSTEFVLLLGIIAGFVEQLVPSLLEEQAGKLGKGETKPSAAAAGAS